MITKAVLDRFEEDKAVLMVGDAQDLYVVPRILLPSDAKEGQRLQVDLVDDVIRSVVIDTAATAAAQESIAEKLRRLREGDSE